MKTAIPTLFTGIVFSLTFIACGPSAEEKAAAEQRMKDSIAAVEKAAADSMMAVQQKAMDDSLAAVKAMQDSMAMAKAKEDSLAALKSAKPKPKKSNPEKINEEMKKATKGRG